MESLLDFEQIVIQSKLNLSEGCSCCVLGVCREGEAESWCGPGFGISAVRMG